jgi:surface antigen
MRATMSSAAPVAASRLVGQIMGVAAACAMLAACVTGNDDSKPSNQTTGTLLGAALGGTVGGLAFGSVGGVVGGTLVGALAGNLVGRALDEQERQRLAEATRQAYASDTDQPVVYTVEPTAKPSTATQSAPPQPTVVAAKPVGPKTTRSDGGTCRPIELTATKNGQTTRETTTFCQAAGSNDLKPVSV